MAGAPLLQVLTRCWRRPSLLQANLKSVAALGEGVEQTCVVDTEGRGIGASYEALARLEVRGQYIWILDDDDICIEPGLVGRLRELMRKRPDVVMVRMDHGDGLGVLPGEAQWGQAPVQGGIGCSGFMVRREVWLAERDVLVPGEYASDYRFIARVFGGGYVVEWLDVVASRVQRISHGAAE